MATAASTFTGRLDDLIVDRYVHRQVRNAELQRFDRWSWRHRSAYVGLLAVVGVGALLLLAGPAWTVAVFPLALAEWRELRVCGFIAWDLDGSPTSFDAWWYRRGPTAYVAASTAVYGVLLAVPLVELGRVRLPSATAQATIGAIVLSVSVGILHAVRGVALRRARAHHVGDGDA